MQEMLTPRSRQLKLRPRVEQGEEAGRKDMRDRWSLQDDCPRAESRANQAEENQEQKIARLEAELQEGKGAKLKLEGAVARCQQELREAHKAKEHILFDLQRERKKLHELEARRGQEEEGRRQEKALCLLSSQPDASAQGADQHTISDFRALTSLCFPSSTLSSSLSQP